MATLGNKKTNEPAQTLLTITPLPSGYFVLASAKLFYFNPNVLTESNYQNTKEFSPVVVGLREIDKQSPLTSF